MKKKTKNNKKNFRTLETKDHGNHIIAEYGLNISPELIGVELEQPNSSNQSSRKLKEIPKIKHELRNRMVIMPEVIENASGINILEKKIKSLIFTTDIAVIRNSNADAVFAVYPFTPSISISQAIMDTSMVPVFVGVGGGLTTGSRSINIALQAELMGAYGVVVNAPMDIDTIEKIADIIDIPIILTVVSEKDNYIDKIMAGVQILNVSAGSNTAKIVAKIREELGEAFPIIATGGSSEETIKKTIEAGANAIIYTPPTTADIFEYIMKEYREKLD